MLDSKGELKRYEMYLGQSGIVSLRESPNGPLVYYSACSAALSTAEQKIADLESTIVLNVADMADLSVMHENELTLASQKLSEAEKTIAELREEIERWNQSSLEVNDRSHKLLEVAEKRKEAEATIGELREEYSCVDEARRREAQDAESARTELTALRAEREKELRMAYMKGWETSAGVLAHAIEYITEEESVAVFLVSQSKEGK